MIAPLPSTARAIYRALVEAMGDGRCAAATGFPAPGNWPPTWRCRGPRSRPPTPGGRGLPPGQGRRRHIRDRRGRARATEAPPEPPWGRSSATGGLGVRARSDQLARRQSTGRLPSRHSGPGAVSLRYLAPVGERRTPASSQPSPAPTASRPGTLRCEKPLPGSWAGRGRYEPSPTTSSSPTALSRHSTSPPESCSLPATWWR